MVVGHSRGLLLRHRTMVVIRAVLRATHREIMGHQAMVVTTRLIMVAKGDQESLVLIILQQCLVGALTAKRILTCHRTVKPSMQLMALMMAASKMGADALPPSALSHPRAQSVRETMTAPVTMRMTMMMTSSIGLSPRLLKRRPSQENLRQLSQLTRKSQLKRNKLYWSRFEVTSKIKRYS